MNQLTFAGAKHPYPGMPCLDGGRTPVRPCSQSTAYASIEKGRGRLSPVFSQTGARSLNHFHPDNYHHSSEPISLAQPVSDNQSYIILSNTANLEHLLANKMNETTICERKFIVLSCSCGRHIVPHSCMSGKCTKCAPQVVRRRALRSMERLTFSKSEKYNDSNSKTICYTTFTIPELLREQYQDIKKLTDLRRTLWALLKKNYNAFFGVQAIHPFGDENPGKFNPHLNFLWRVKRGKSTFIDVKRLREQFKNILAIDYEPVCYHEYSKIPSQVYTWCAYVLRAFPQFIDWLSNIQWYGSIPTKLEKEEFVCSVCLEKFCALGYLSARLVDEYYESFYFNSRAPPWDVIDNIQYFHDRKTA